MQTDERESIRESVHLYATKTLNQSRILDRSVGIDPLSSGDVSILHDLGWLDLVAGESFGGGGGGLDEIGVVVEALGYEGVGAPVAENAAALWALGRASLRDDHAYIESIAHVLHSLSQGGLIIPAFPSDARLRVSLATSDALAPALTERTQLVVEFPQLNPLLLHWTAYADTRQMAVSELPATVEAGFTTLDGGIVALAEVGELVKTQSLGAGAEAMRCYRDTCAAVALLSCFEVAGLLKRISELTTTHIKQRMVFDKPIGAFQAAQHRAVAIHATADHLSIAAASVASNFVESGNPRDIWLLRYWLLERVGEALRDAHMLHGGLGVTTDSLLQLLTRRVWTKVGGGLGRYETGIFALNSFAHNPT